MLPWALPSPRVSLLDMHQPAAWQDQRTRPLRTREAMVAAARVAPFAAIYSTGNSEEPWISSLLVRAEWINPFVVLAAPGQHRIDR